MMNDLDLYRRMFAADDGAETCCWYMGQLFAYPDGYPPILIMQVEAVMVYRAEMIADDCVRIRWTEIGVFRDAVTGETSGRWQNPITGTWVTLPATFTEGPGDYVVSAVPEGVAVTMNQPHASIERIDVALTRSDGRVLLDQNEHKMRVMMGSGGKVGTHTRLFMGADAADIDIGGTIAFKGGYQSTTDGLVAFAGFDENMTGRMVTQGPMRKASTTEIVNSEAWARLRAHHGDWFDGDRLTAKWPD